MHLGNTCICAFETIECVRLTSGFLRHTIDGFFAVGLFESAVYEVAPNGSGGVELIQISQEMLVIDYHVDEAR